MSDPRPSNSLVTPLLTDLYQITMAYAHWKVGRHNIPAVFEVFFRKNPFGGEYTVVAGLDEVLKLLQSYKFSDSDIEYLKQVPALKNCEVEFFDFLKTLDCSQVTVHAVLDGTVVFPRVPLLIIEAPLALGQLLETTILTLINYPSLLCTQAARMVLAARDKNLMSTKGQYSKQPVCIEFGLRRAQGPDGGFSASKYAIMGGFIGTSNCAAGKHFGLRLSGTHAHAFIQSYNSLEDVEELMLLNRKSANEEKILPAVLKYRHELANTKSSYFSTTNEGELAAFIAYAFAFPDSFLCLIDTYDSLQSGLLNFILVAMVLDDFGYKPKGIRLDSGDLAYLSVECAKLFAECNRDSFLEMDIVASNDINEAVLHALNKQTHAITVYGIGTNLVTCQAQPALGCVYKLVELNGEPRMKLSQEISKVLIPGKKKTFRLYGKDEQPLLDVMLQNDEEEPAVGVRFLCRHPFVERKRAAVTPSRVERLHHTVFLQGTVHVKNRDLTEARDAVVDELDHLRPDILRYINPTPYKVSISEKLFVYLHEMWQGQIPIAELS